MSKTNDDIKKSRQLGLKLLSRKIVEVNVDGDIVDLELDNGTHFIFETHIAIMAK